MSQSVSTTVSVLLGSLRAGSVHRRLAEGLRDRAPEGVRIDLVDDLGGLPFYDEDIDTDDVPDQVLHLRERVGAADAVLAVTPEYNGTMPAALNNAIDWLSRPYGAGAMVGKPFGVVGTSPSPYGGRWAHADTLRSAKVAGARPVEEATLSQPGAGVDVLTDAGVREALDAALRTLLGGEVAAA